MLSNLCKKAFTLIELIAVVVVLGILAALALPTFSAVKLSSAEQTITRSAEGVVNEAKALASFSGSTLGNEHIAAALADYGDTKDLTPSVGAATLALTHSGISVTATIANNGAISVSNNNNGGGAVTIQTGSINNFYLGYGRDADYNYNPDNLRINFYNGGTTLGAVGNTFTFTNLKASVGCINAFGAANCPSSQDISLFEGVNFTIVGATNSMGAVYIIQLTQAQRTALANMESNNINFSLEGSFTISQ